MCVTNNKELDIKMRELRDHGMSKSRKYWHNYPGFNYRMTNLQAAIGVAQLERIDDILDNRRKLELVYRDILEVCENVKFQKNNLHRREKITWLVSILIKSNRDKYLELLKNEGIDARPFFYPLSIMPPYKKYLFSNKRSLEISGKGINLPTNVHVNQQTMEKIKKFFKSNLEES